MRRSVGIVRASNRVGIQAFVTPQRVRITGSFGIRFHGCRCRVISRHLVTRQPLLDIASDLCGLPLATPGWLFAVTHDPAPNVSGLRAALPLAELKPPGKPLRPL